MFFLPKEGEMNDFPAPLTPADCDLRDFKFIPIDIVRLFNSEFHARSDDSVWRAGITLWMKSFHQVPAGSIPDDDVALARLAELGRDVKSWKKIKEGSLYGWVKCSDGRLYHPVVAEKALEAWKGKTNQRARTGKARLQAMLTRLLKAADIFEIAHAENNIQTLLSELSQSLSQTEFNALEMSVTESVAEAKRKRKGEGQVKGQGKDFKERSSEPVGSDASASVGQGSDLHLDPEQMTKEELWSVGKSILMQAGMPEKQCGSFIGKLVKDYSAEIVIDAVRATVVERPADPATFLVGACKHKSGRKSGKSLEDQQKDNTEEARRLLFGQEAINA